MSPEAAEVTAVVFVLSKHVFAETPRYLQWCIDRGYRPLGVIKEDAALALALLKAGKVQVIVFAHHDGQILDDGPTRRIPLCASATVQSRNMIRALPYADDVRRMIEGTVASPVGLDPESIRAARRIWAHFAKHGCA